MHWTNIQQQKQTDLKRKQAVKAIIKESGLDAVLEMGTSAKYSAMLGKQLAMISKIPHARVLEFLDKENGYQLMAMGYIGGHFQLHGMEWIEGQLDNYSGKLPDEILLLFYLSTEGNPTIWD
ncbi:MAG: hypothetical protein JWQ57_757 [Mucilaginibacter sp.]|nr:hypothetical protein [Mucilaginibacter sp.]